MHKLRESTQRFLGVSLRLALSEVRRIKSMTTCHGVSIIISVAMHDIFLY